MASIASGTKSLEMKELEIGKVYKNYFSDLVQVISIDFDKEVAVLRNLTKSCKSWSQFKNIYLYNFR